MARRKSGDIPSLRRHKASGKAVVTLSGQDFYCGTWGTKTALAAYDRHVAEWLARGRRPVPQDDSGPAELSIVELIVAYKRHAERHYRKDGRKTNEVKTILAALKVVNQLYGKQPANEFGPLKLAAIQQAMIRLDWCRKYINKQVGRIVRMFAWGVSQELVRPDVANALKEVPGLLQGRTEAKESEPVKPVDEATIQATLHHLPKIVADMVRLQRLTGARPEEITMIRPCDLDTMTAVWAYRPESHKTQHHGRERVIFIGPKGQHILRPYLVRAKDSYCFSPADSERKRRQEAHESRQTPLTYGNAPGTNRQRSPKRMPGNRYTAASYRRAIHRACKLARVEQWSPNRLRHSAATEIRKRYGLEASQVVLGHSAANVTQVYAERDLAKAAAVMAEVG